MRRLLPALAIFGAFAAQPALAQKHCAAPADQAAFEVQALRSHLMVLATGCSESDRYNAFVRRYQADLAANDQAVTGWFKRRYGGRGQAEHDRFITDLANAVSNGHSVLGGDVCPRDGLMFAEVLTLRGSGDLPHYAAAKDLVPASVEICAGQPAGGAKPAVKASTKKR